VKPVAALVSDIPKGLLEINPREKDNVFSAT
jgi:hypothetical protein